MIKNVGEMLEALRRAESAKLNSSNIKHGPTIGAMYEGLTRSLLERSIPQSMQLRVVSGFVIDGQGGTSGQIDCMLVSGEGTPVPYVDGVYQWHVRDVMAVFEVKKSLFGSELADAHSQLLQVAKTYSNWIQAADDQDTYDLKPSMRAYAECVGSILPSVDDWHTMDPSRHLIWHTIMTDQIAPIRIVLGYGGYSTEHGLRKGFLEFLDSNVKKLGFGAPSLPNLFVAGGASLVKLSGHPYHAPQDSDGWWPLVASTRYNPTQLILELLWTRISHHHPIARWFGDDLELEGLSPLIYAKPHKWSPNSNEWGWGYRGIPLTPQQLAANPEAIDWEPVELDMDQYVVIDKLCKEDAISAADPDLLAMLADAGKQPGPFFDSLIKTSLVAWRADQLVLTTTECQTVILPDGRLIAADNNTGRLERWLDRYMMKRVE